MTVKTVSELVKKLSILLTEQHKKLAVAESCTGGWLAKALTDQSGSSDWFERGFVTYSNLAKHEMLSVSLDTLENFGAVSEKTVAEMATGALEHSHADVSVSISGIAGPGGGSAEKPVGLVWFGFAQHEATDTVVLSKKEIFTGDREAVRHQAVTFALQQLVDLLQNSRA